jgi:hypothetical protein
MMHVAARIAALGGLLALLALGACGSEYRPLQPGAAGYQHATYGYVVAYRAGSQTVLEPGWAPHPHAAVTRALPLDYDGDGAVDDELDVPVFDLLYSHSATAGTVFHPVLLVLGYANTAGDFAAQHDAFEDLIGHLRFARDPDVERLRGELGACVGAETLVEFLVLPEGRVGAHATLADPTREPCISRTLVHAELSPAHWPRTFAVRVTPSDR